MYIYSMCVYILSMYPRPFRKGLSKVWLSLSAGCHVVRTEQKGDTTAGLVAGAISRAGWREGRLHESSELATRPMGGYRKNRGWLREFGIYNIPHALFYRFF